RPSTRSRADRGDPRGRRAASSLRTSRRLTDSLIASGKLYADGRGNAVFLLQGKDNTPVGAELRGTGPQRWCGMAPDSQKDLGYFSVQAPDATMVILCESAIDAISCLLLHPVLSVYPHPELGPTRVGFLPCYPKALPSIVVLIPTP